MDDRGRAPWWLAGGGERCRICLQRYVLEMELRCVACDLGTCPFCAVVVHETREVHCAHCVPAGLAGREEA
jgi:hypothetical protein